MPDGGGGWAKQGRRAAKPAMWEGGRPADARPLGMHRARPTEEPSASLLR